MSDLARRTVITGAFAAGLLFALPAASDGPPRLGPEEIAALLSGNTAIGTWDRRLYRQYFAEDGRTLYKPNARPVEEGKWRVNPDTGAYESWWEQTGWTAYEIGIVGYGYVWIDSEGKTHPFEMRDGNRLDN